MTQIKLTVRPVTDLLACPHCDMSMLPQGSLPRGGPAAIECPLCGFVDEVTVVEVGEGFRFNLAEQKADVAKSVIYPVANVTYDGDMVLVDVPGLLQDPAFHACQEGVAPLSEAGWVGHTGILGAKEYRLLVMIRVSGLPEGTATLFRIEFPQAAREKLAEMTYDHAMVIVSHKKGVVLGEVGSLYLDAMENAGGRPGEPVPISEWADFDDWD